MPAARQCINLSIACPRLGVHLQGCRWRKAKDYFQPARRESPSLRSLTHTSPLLYSSQPPFANPCDLSFRRSFTPCADTTRTDRQNYDLRGRLVLPRALPTLEIGLLAPCIALPPLHHPLLLRQHGRREEARRLRHRARRPRRQQQTQRPLRRRAATASALRECRQHGRHLEQPDHFHSGVLWEQHLDDGCE